MKWVENHWEFSGKIKMDSVLKEEEEEEVDILSSWKDFTI